MCFSKNVCPVPFDQCPLNEFYALKRSCFFSFFGFKLDTYLLGIFGISCVSVFVFAPLIFMTIKFSWDKFIITEFFCLIFVLIVFLIRLYLGWSYIMNRLFSATVFYEESGWYDGQIWIKSPEILIKDRLIGTHYVLPVLRRIKVTFVILLSLLFVDILINYLLC